MPHNDDQMTSKYETYGDYLLENDFFEIALQERQRLEIERQQSAHNRPLTEEDLAQAESHGYSKGLAEGRQQAEEDLNRKLEQHISVLQNHFAQIDRHAASLQQHVLASAAVLLDGMLTTLLADARTHYAPELLTKTLADALAQVTTQPRLMVSVHPATSAYLQETLLPNPAFAPYRDRITVQTADNMALGDCRIDWDSGGIKAELDHVLSQFRAQLHAASGTPADPIVALETEAPAPETPTEERTEEHVEAAAEHAPEAEDDTAPLESAEEATPEDLTPEDSQA